MHENFKICSLFFLTTFDLGLYIKKGVFRCHLQRSLPKERSFSTTVIPPYRRLLNSGSSLSQFIENGIAFYPIITLRKSSIFKTLSIEIYFTHESISF